MSFCGSLFFFFDLWFWGLIIYTFLEVFLLSFGLNCRTISLVCRSGSSRIKTLCSYQVESFYLVTLLGLIVLLSILNVLLMWCTFYLTVSSRGKKLFV